MGEVNKLERRGKGQVVQEVKAANGGGDGLNLAKQRAQGPAEGSESDLLLERALRKRLPQWHQRAPERPFGGRIWLALVRFAGHGSTFSVLVRACYLTPAGFGSTKRALKLTVLCYNYSSEITLLDLAITDIGIL